MDKKKWIIVAASAGGLVLLWVLWSNSQSQPAASVIATATPVASQPVAAATSVAPASQTAALPSTTLTASPGNIQQSPFLRTLINQPTI